MKPELNNKIIKLQKLTLHMRENNSGNLYEWIFKDGSTCKSRLPRSELDLQYRCSGKASLYEICNRYILLFSRYFIHKVVTCNTCMQYLYVKKLPWKSDKTIFTHVQSVGAFMPDILPEIKNVCILRISCCTIKVS